MFIFQNVSFRADIQIDLKMQVKLICMLPGKVAFL